MSIYYVKLINLFYMILFIKLLWCSDLSLLSLALEGGEKEIKKNRAIFDPASKERLRLTTDFK